MDKDIKKIKAVLRNTLIIESSAVKEQISHIDDNHIKSVIMIINIIKNRGKIIIVGIGKSGFIARKISATFSSVGIPSVFVNLTELLHGDLGMISQNDLIFILSYSGESEELKGIATSLKAIGSKIIVMTGRPRSFLGRLADCVIMSSVKKEACPFNLVPTSSTTAMLAIGDAIALGVASINGFRKIDFARYHPGGNLGKKLTLKIKEIMHMGRNNPIIPERAKVKDALIVMTKTKLGAVSVVDERKKLVGYFTDGDLRRKLQIDDAILSKKIKEVMTKNPKTVTADILASDAAEILKKYNCDNLPVVDDKNRPIGIIDERDLISSGLM